MDKITSHKTEKNPFTRLLQNTAILLGGDSVAAIIGMISFAVTARVLGAENLGMLVLIDAFVRVVDRLLNFQSWQFLIKFGSDARSANDHVGFKSLIKFGTFVDVATALVGCCVAVITAELIGKWQNWSPEMIMMARLYSLIIALNFSGIPTGLLRLFDRFKIFSIYKSFVSFLKLCSVLVAGYLNANWQVFALIWMLAEILECGLITFAAWAELKKQGYTKIWSAPLRGLRQKYPGLWQFMISTNLTGAVKVGFRELDVLVIGKMLSFSDVSLYKLAKKICVALARFNNPLYQALYPELTRSWAERDISLFKKLVKKMMLIMGGFSLVSLLGMVLFGKSVIVIMTGSAFLAAYGVMIAYYFAKAIAMTTLPLQPMILAMGKAQLSFWIQFIPVCIYFPALYFLIEAFGLVGAGYAFIVYMGTRALYQWLVIQTKLRKEIHARVAEVPV